MSSEVIPIASVSSSDVAFTGDAYLAFEEEGVLDNSSNVPYFVFEVAVPAEKRARIAARLRTDLGDQSAAEMIAFLEARDWNTSFLYLG